MPTYPVDALLVMRVRPSTAAFGKTVSSSGMMVTALAAGCDARTSRLVPADRSRSQYVPDVSSGRTAVKAVTRTSTGAPSPAEYPRSVSHVNDALSFRCTHTPPAWSFRASMRRYCVYGVGGYSSNTSCAMMAS
jgi:hypothetical protein